MYADRYGTGKKQESIPGLFESAEDAQAAQADAVVKLANEGPLAVWPQDAEHKVERNKRGQVRAWPTIVRHVYVIIWCAHREQSGHRVGPRARSGIMERRYPKRRR